MLVPSPNRHSTTSASVTVRETTEENSPVTSVTWSILPPPDRLAQRDEQAQLIRDAFDQPGVLVDDRILAVVGYHLLQRHRLGGYRHSVRWMRRAAKTSPATIITSR